jgi:DnaA family protein
MRQLALGVKLRDSSRFSSFFAGANDASVAMLRGLRPAAHTPIVWLCGPSGSGKTHLLQAICAAAGERSEAAAFIPLAQLAQAGPELLDGCEQLAWVCIDDVDRVLGDPAWQRALFSLYARLDISGGRLILAAANVPAAYDIALRDLGSRLNAALLCRLQALDDDAQWQALQLRATQRGMQLPPETATYLQKRVPRNLSWLCDFLDALDEASLSAQRALTIPFVRTVLHERGVITDEVEKN